MVEEVGVYEGLFGGLLVVLAEGVETVVEEGSEARAEGWEDATCEVWKDDAAEDVQGSSPQRRQSPTLPRITRRSVYLYQVAVFFPKGAVTGKGCEGEIEEGSESAELGTEGVGCASAEEAAVEVGKGVC